MIRFTLLFVFLFSSFSQAVDFAEKHTLVASFNSVEAKELANAFGLNDQMRAGKQVVFNGLELSFYVMGSMGGNGIANYRYSANLTADLSKLKFEKQNSTIWLLPEETISKEIYEKLNVFELEVTHFENGEAFPVKQKQVIVNGVQLICQYSTEITPQYFCSFQLKQ